MRDLLSAVVGSGRRRRRRFGRSGRTALHRWLPVGLLVLSIGIAGAAVYEAHRALRGHSDTTVRLLRDYGAFAAWSFRQHVAEELGRSSGGSAEYDSARHVPLFRRALAERPLLPAALTKGRGSSELLIVHVRARDGRTLFASDSVDDWMLGGSDAFGPELGRAEVHATIRPGQAVAVVGGHPGPRRQILIGMLLLACGLGAVAVHQVRREGELARLRSDFVSSVSHELRTPLAQVQLFLETLRYGRYRTDAQREWILGNMERETTRLAALVDNVLHFSRAERRALGGVREPTRLPEYLEAIAAAFAPLASVRDVRVVTAVEPGLVAPLHADSFRQVVLNLLDNALKYGPRGQEIRMTAALRDGRARITVEDQGPGVEPRERERIWDPFRRGERAVGSVVVGSGIGLSVVRDIVESHGGSAWVEDAAQGGARFVIDLPGWSEAESESSDGASRRGDGVQSTA